MLLFSIIIPVYNRASFLTKIIGNIYDQSYKNFEIIIIDDGSTDNTKDLAIQISKENVHYYYQHNQGVSVARNSGAGKARGEFLIFLDSDDSVDKKWLADFHKKILENDYDLVCCGVHVNKENMLKGKSLQYEIIDAKSISKRLLAGAFAIKKELFFKIDQYDTQMRFGENAELSIRLQQYNLNVGYIDSVNLNYFPAESGGGRNLNNRADSNIYFLNKHHNWFITHKRVHRHYLQSTAVALYKLGNITQAHEYFYKAWLVDPFNLKGVMRLFISHIPIIAGVVWKKHQ